MRKNTTAIVVLLVMIQLLYYFYRTYPTVTKNTLFSNYKSPIIANTVGLAFYLHLFVLHEISTASLLL